MLPLMQCTLLLEGCRNVAFRQRVSDDVFACGALDHQAGDCICMVSNLPMRAGAYFQAHEPESCILATIIYVLHLHSTQHAGG